MAPPVVERYRVGAITQSECTRCGACCCNARDNQAEGSREWVVVTDEDVILASPRLARRLVVVNEEGERHLRLDPDGRCLALRGRLGVRVECSVYRERPAACRIVEAGSEECLQARRERGID
jgi:Fe-S-cluster containining protein